MRQRGKTELLSSTLKPNTARALLKRPLLLKVSSRTIASQLGSVSARNVWASVCNHAAAGSFPPAVSSHARTASDIATQPHLIPTFGYLPLSTQAHRDTTNQEHHGSFTGRLVLLNWRYPCTFFKCKITCCKSALRTTQNLRLWLTCGGARALQGPAEHAHSQLAHRIGHQQPFAGCYTSMQKVW